MSEIKLYRVQNSHVILRRYMSHHYSQPLGFVGRNICYLVFFNAICYGAMVAGSATLHLPGRDEFFCITKDLLIKPFALGRIINNVFCHFERRGKYPTRNFTINALQLFRQRSAYDWSHAYKENVIGFETLVELPRVGTMYIRDKWKLVGETKGFTCKRTAGVGTDDWSGKRVWNSNQELRPKHVFARLI